MYAHSSPTLYRRRSTAANLNADADKDRIEERNYCGQRYHITVNNRHCRCCSMSTSDLINSPSFDEIENRSADDSDFDNYRHFPDTECEKFDGIDSKADSAVQKRTDRRSYSRTGSIISTLSSPNILLLGGEQLATNNDSGNRLRERLAASIAGLKELDILREKHRRMVEEVKAQLKLSADSTHRNPDGFLVPVHTAAPRSPSPADMSSNISHRSSLSMDSGVCLSLASDPSCTNGHRPYYPHQRRLSTDSITNYRFNYQSPTRKTSWANSSVSATTPTSDDEGCYGACPHDGPDRPRPYNSVASITAALAAAEATVAPRTTVPSFRYRRRLDGNGSCATPSRPRSLYGCYPEEDTVIVEPPSPRQVCPPSSNGRPARRASGYYRPQVPTIVANLPDTKCSDHASVARRRRPNGERASAVDPVFRASRVFIDALPENEALGDRGEDQFRATVALRPRLYETRRPRPTSMAVPPSSSKFNQLASFFSKDEVNHDRGRAVEARRSLDPAPPRSSSSTLVRQHSAASASCRQPQSPVLNGSRKQDNVSVVTTGEASSCSSDGCASDGGSVLLVSNGREHGAITRSVSSQSSDSSKSKRSKEKTWHESADL